MADTQPILDAATQAQWGHSTAGLRPVRLSLSAPSAARAVALRIQALAAAIRRESHCICWQTFEGAPWPALTHRNQNVHCE